MISVNMMSSATKVKGQGVGSAYIEQMNLMNNYLYDKFKVSENEPFGGAFIQHYHTVDLNHFFFNLFTKNKCVSVGSVHFLPETVDKSLNLPKPARHVFYKYLISFYKSMDYLVVVNPTFIQKLAELGVDREKIVYIPNYVSGDNFYKMSDSQKKEIRRKYGLDENKFTVLGVGQLQTRKGVTDFVKTAEMLPDVQFVWAGGFSFKNITEGYKELKEITENPPDNVKFLGIVEREDMNGVYNLSDVMFLPSYEELFPMAILESLSCNVPILLRDIDIYPQILNGYYTAGKNVDEFADIISRLKNDSSFYQDMCNAAAEGNRFYSADHVSSIWESFYKKAFLKLGEKKSNRVRVNQNIGEV